MTALVSAAATETGQVRSNNQDAVLVAEPLFAVADGMGGHAAGEVASRVAIDALRARPVATLDELALAVEEANRAVWERSSTRNDLRGMGTTMCAVALVDHEGEEVVGVANVGDSRVYRFHDGELGQITQDHSLVGDLQREGRLSEEEARTHPQRNILTRVLGNDAYVKVDTFAVTPYRGDRFLLCSDGLFNEVDEDRMAAVLRRLRDPEEAARELVRLANEGGGRDNISVVLVDVTDDGGRAEGASRALAADGTTGGASTAVRVVSAPPADVALAAAPEAAPPAPPPEPPPPRARRLTARSVAFVLAVVVILVLAGGAVALFARGTYYVGVDGDQVAIYRGRPGGLLWLDPTLAEPTSLAVADLPPARQDDVLDGHAVSSLDAARTYVENLVEEAEDQGRPISTTTTAPGPTTTGAPVDATTTLPPAPGQPPQPVPVSVPPASTDPVPSLSAAPRP